MKIMQSNNYFCRLRKPSDFAATLLKEFTMRPWVNKNRSKLPPSPRFDHSLPSLCARRQWTDASPRSNNNNQSVHASNERWQKHSRGRYPLPIITELFFTKRGPSASTGVSDSVWMTEIGQRAFEFCERKNVGRSVGYKHNRASTGLVVNHCTVTISPKGKSLGTWNVSPKKLFLCLLYRFGARGRNML